MKKLYLLLLTCFLSANIFAQDKHKITLSIGSDQYLDNLSFKGVNMNDIISNYGLGYEYKMNARLGFYAGFSQWLSINWQNNQYAPREELKKRATIDILDYDYDKILYQKNYSFINLGAIYTLYQNKVHEINAKGGVILAFGKDAYLEHISPHPNDLYENTDALFFDISTDEHNAFHTGANIGINYNYHFHKNFSLGANMTYDYYFTKNKPRLTYGIQLAYRF